MKPLKKHYDYIPYVYFPLFFLALIIVFFFPAQALLCFRTHWLILIFSLFFVFPPVGNIRLGEKESAKSFLQMFGLILSAVIGINLIYWGLIYICFAGLPLQLPNNSSLILAQTGKTLLITNGLFPWALMTSIAVGLAYVSYNLKKTGKFSFLLQSLLKNSGEDVPTIMTDFLARTIAHFSLAYAIGLVCLLTIIIMAHSNHLVISNGLRIAPMAVATLLIFAINTQPWQITIRYLVGKKIPLPILSILFIISTAIFVVIANEVAIQLTENFPQKNNLLVSFAIPHWQINWQLLSTMWWIVWTPLISGLITYLAKGYRIRTIIFIGFFAAMVSFLIITLLTQTNIIFNPQWRWLNYCLPWFGLIILMLLFMKKKFLMYQMRAVIPGTKLEKHRSTIFYTQSLFQTATFIIILYLPLGIYILNIFTFIMIFPWAILLTMIFVSLAKFFIQKLKGAGKLSKL